MKCALFCQILMKLEFLDRVSKENPHASSFMIGSRTVPCGRTGGQTWRS